MTGWSQYVLDNFATVGEAVEALEGAFYIVALELSSGHAGVAHLSILDPGGDSAIFEYVDGKLVIHHGKQYTVMTNSPTFDQQLALNAYRETVGGQTFPPGTNRASDRFVRASYYMGTVVKPDDPIEALATALSVIRSVSARGYHDAGTTEHRGDRVAHDVGSEEHGLLLRIGIQPVPVLVELKNLNFVAGSPVRKLSLTENSALLVDGKFVSGEVARHFRTDSPFAFAGVKD